MSKKLKFFLFEHEQIKSEYLFAFNGDLKIANGWIYFYKVASVNRHLFNLS